MKKGESIVIRRDVIKQMVKEEIKCLELLLEKVQESLKYAPKGKLRVKYCKGYPQYYNRIDGYDKNGTYICKKKKELAYALAQKEYDISVLALATNYKRNLEQFLKIIDIEEESNILAIYENLSNDRKKLVTPYILTDEQFIKAWQNVEYKGNSFSFGTQEIYTEKGERVRSKSEKILADKFYMMNIPYRYEYPLKLKGNRIVYPDFTLLNTRTRKEYYLEHCGLMDEENYFENTLKKLRLYHKNGIYEGDKLLLTYETKNLTIDMKDLENMIARYLK
ncbi:MAG: hypothetical protein E7262_02030 [Lachnospiraceae bacterium]|nr:hypothetical protein [Lachnospiraceae bacterium]